MNDTTLKDMIEFLAHKADHTGFADPNDRLRLEAIRGRLEDLFRLRGLLINCPDAEEDMAQSLMKCLDLRSGS
jgi:hypothetical protein